MSDLSNLPNFTYINNIKPSILHAQHTKSKLEYAIKIIPKSNFITRPKEQQQFKSTVNLLKQLNFPLVACLYDCVEDENNYYLITEYASGGSLEEKLSNSHNQFEMSEISKFFTQIVSALTYLHHEKQIAHLNLNPSHILFDKSGSIKLIGFGKQQQITDAASFLSSHNDLIFSSPEICSGRPFTSSSDIWAIGIILYRIIFNEYPFEDNDPAVLSSSIVNMSVIYPSLKEEILIDLMKRLLQKDPSQRAPLKSLINHPFYQKTFHINSETQNDSIDRTILKKMQSMNIDLTTIHGDLLSHKTTDATAIYKQLKLNQQLALIKAASTSSLVESSEDMTKQSISHRNTIPKRKASIAIRATKSRNCIFTAALSPLVSLENLLKSQPKKQKFDFQ